MSHAATNWAIQQRGLRPTTKIVLWHLCDRYNPDYGCFPSQARLAHDCEISRATLNRHLDALEERELIRRVRMFDPETRQQRNTRYLLGIEDGFELSPAVGVKAVLKRQIKQVNAHLKQTIHSRQSSARRAKNGHSKLHKTRVQK